MDKSIPFNGLSGDKDEDDEFPTSAPTDAPFSAASDFSSSLSKRFLSDLWKLAIVPLSPRFSYSLPRRRCDRPTTVPLSPRFSCSLPRRRCCRDGR